MQTLIHADTFFFITAVFVIVLIVIAIIAGVRVIQILGEFKKISTLIRKESNDLSEDLRYLRNEIKSTGSAWKSIFSLIALPIRRTVKKRRQSREKKEAVEINIDQNEDGEE